MNAKLSINQFTYRFRLFQSWPSCFLYFFLFPATLLFTFFSSYFKQLDILWCNRKLLCVIFYQTSRSRYGLHYGLECNFEVPQQQKQQNYMLCFADAKQEPPLIDMTDSQQLRGGSEKACFELTRQTELGLNCSIKLVWR